MGYESEWKLAIVASTNTKLSEFIQWMEDYVNDTLKAFDARDCMQCILACEVARWKTAIEFGGSGTECGAYWNSVIYDIRIRAKGDKELDSAYARTGEDFDDNDLRHGDHTSVYIHRRISGFDYTGIAPIKKQVNAISEDQQPEEEKCGCGKMKDVDKSCWWCGG
ncbi:hypothetical protein LCGC14_2155260 [marine sediment metagenome]|uniref:Uncharacterized protein n=1 Tax=marine sediment metagenome TaxID=412755 RepID=A0A0F9DUK3_9ZZZZ